VWYVFGEKEVEIEGDDDETGDIKTVASRDKRKDVRFAWIALTQSLNLTKVLC